MATITNGENGLSIRNKLNAVLEKDLGTSTWSALQTAYPDDGAALLALPNGTSVYVTDRDQVYHRNADGTKWRARSAGRLFFSNIVGTPQVETLPTVFTPGTLHLTVGTGDTITLEQSSDGTFDTEPVVSYTTSSSIRIASGITTIRLVRTAGSSGASSAVYDPAVIPETMIIYKNLGGLNGETPAPIGTAAGPTATLLQVVFPAYTFASGDIVVVRPRVRRRGATATADIGVRLGTLGTSSDALIRTQALAATDTLDWRGDIEITFTTTTRYTTTNANLPNQTSTGSFATRSTSVDVAAAMTLGVYLSNGNAADNFDLISMHVVRTR